MRAPINIMIVDAFIFFNEKELAELRIKYLNDLIDYFIIIKADVTHQGQNKIEDPKTIRTYCHMLLMVCSTDFTYLLLGSDLRP